MQRRAVLSAVGAVLGATAAAGCLGDDGDGVTATPGSPTSTATPTATETDTATEAFSHPEASNEPDPDLPIRAENYDDETHSVSVVVARGETTVHEATYELDPGADREVYNLEAADPDGIETFTVTATFDDQSESVSVQTNACHGGLNVWVQENGDFSMILSIC